MGYTVRGIVTGTARLVNSGRFWATGETRKRAVDGYTEGNEHGGVRVDGKRSGYIR